MLCRLCLCFDAASRCRYYFFSFYFLYFVYFCSCLVLHLYTYVYVLLYLLLFFPLLYLPTLTLLPAPCFKCISCACNVKRGAASSLQLEIYKTSEIYYIYIYTGIHIFYMVMCFCLVSAVARLSSLPASLFA